MDADEDLSWAEGGEWGIRGEGGWEARRGLDEDFLKFRYCDDAHGDGRVVGEDINTPL